MFQPCVASTTYSMTSLARLPDALKRTARVIFLGAPGSGKRTYARELARELGVPTISTGDMIREHIERGSPKGKEFTGYVSNGLLAPDELVTDMLISKLEADPAHANDGTHVGFILDGFPRTIAQAHLLEEKMPSSTELTSVINICLKEEFIIEKLMGRRVCSKCKKSFNVAAVLDVENGYDMPALPCPAECEELLTQRVDDTPEIIHDRIRIYNDEAKPLLKFYKQRNVLQNFEVKKGLKDLPVLLDLVHDSLCSARQSAFH